MKNSSTEERTGADAPRPAPALLQEAPLRALIAAQVITGITAQGGKGGFILQIRFGEGAGVLANAKGETRVFASLLTVVALLQRLGHPKFEVDATKFSRGLVRAAQPERSAAMKSGRLLQAQSKAKASKAVAIAIHAKPTKAIKPSKAPKKSSP
jgi:hypothetical protein